MCRPTVPADRDEDEEEERNREEPEHGPALRPAPRDRRRHLRSGISWGTGLRVVLAVLEAIAVLTQEEALAVAARALRATGNLIVDAGQHRRS